MPQRMAAESVAREKNHIQREHDRSDADAKMFRAVRGREPHSFPRVMRKKNDEQNGNVGEIAMDVLQDQREIFFAEIFFTRLADGARNRVSPKSLVIRAAIIIAGEAKSARSPQNKKGRRKHQPRRPK